LGYGDVKVGRCESGSETGKIYESTKIRVA
jgi:hypothetical protein